MEAESNNYKILPDGRCSKCGAPMATIEDGKILIKTRIERIDPNTGKVQYKCRDCRQWLDSPFYKIDFKVNKEVCSQS
jgi:hypothetical protein